MKMETKYLKKINGGLSSVEFWNKLAGEESKEDKDETDSSLREA